MFRTLVKVPLRRSLHTRASSSHPTALRFGAILGAGAATTTYFAWKATHGESISLDSAAASKQVPLPRKQAVTPNELTSTSPPVADAPSIHPDATFEPASEPSSANTAADTEVEVQEQGSEGEGGGGGAYDPVTGEINWDCPCLGGMAHGPCGLEFREAFSCFVYSEKEPKGIECVERFQAMQNCFRAHPDVYGDEIMDDDDDDAEGMDRPASTATSPESAPTSEAAPSFSPEPSSDGPSHTPKTSKPRLDTPSSE